MYYISSLLFGFKSPSDCCHMSSRGNDFFFWPNYIPSLIFQLYRSILVSGQLISVASASHVDVMALFSEHANHPWQRYISSS